MQPAGSTASEAVAAVSDGGWNGVQSVERKVAPNAASNTSNRGITPHNWWERKEGILSCTTELVKQLGAIVQHAARTR